MPNASPAGVQPERPFELFVSYSHANEAVKDRLLIHLAPLKRTGLVRTWTDREIPVGSLWREEIDSALERADAAIFLLCENFLASAFCMDVELPRFLQRHADEGVLILFILTDHCGWRELDFIARFQMLPRDAKPIRAFRPLSLAYTQVAQQICETLRAHGKTRGLPSRTHQDQPSPAQAQTAEGLQRLLARLPGRTNRLYGRELELKRLAAWTGDPAGRRGVLIWVGPGGQGKSALTRWWLAGQAWPSGTRFVGHSFYSQGSHNQATSARAFLLAAWAELTGPDATEPGAPPLSDYDLGQRLARAAAHAPDGAPRVLLLDGLEPLQQPSKDPRLNGSVKDQGLLGLLETLAREPGNALCIGSSRLPIPDSDTGIFDAPCFDQFPLHTLPVLGARCLLRDRGLTGSDVELDKLAERCGLHPQALTLAAEFAHTFLDTGAGRQAATIMGWFDAELARGQQTLDRELVNCLGLFDRPAPWGALLALKSAEPPIPGLTQALHDADDRVIAESLARLRQWGLVDCDPADPAPDLDAHPLVRERFGTRLETERPDAWRAAHRCLFDWFRSVPGEERPDGIEGVEPLYRAVGHGCRAGLYAAAWLVYRDRIQRGEQGYTTFQLGAISADLSALAGFFPAGWPAPPVTGDLSEPNRSWLIASVAYCLMSLGRLGEALGPRQMVRERRGESADWNNFCRSSENLIDLQTMLGYWPEAEQTARESVEASGAVMDRSNAQERKLMAFAYLGRALHGQGRLAESAAAFAEAEALQATRAPSLPTLNSLRGFDYDQLLLEIAKDSGDRWAVLGRARASLAYQEQLRHLLSQALDHCIIGQSFGALGEPGTQADAMLDRAVATMRRASNIRHLPILHLARAHHHRDQRRPAQAQTDLNAALAIARRGNMLTYLADGALLEGHLHLDRLARPTPETAAPAADPIPEAARAWAQANEIIRRTGYGRRETELHLLEARLRSHQGRPDQASEALDRAQLRIRAIGQWGLWPRLSQVAAELGAQVPEQPPE
ncbi:TIR and AAA domain-containing protein [uncultured Thiodictyon sp.]|uniref:toll/interleukin-1 receptor domain-containing protein n=1 Tax=uncultured Thiodictyon sp. TaxID=1846217 RepID=UPI0025F420CD|nr:TIR and AAA domain-containing protein [uncultured Thiodictyon sp.]